MFFRHTILPKSLRKEEAWGDVQQSIMAVARELDHLTAVEEWWGDGVEHIGDTDEKNLRNDRSFRLCIESDVLFRIEHLGYRCRRFDVIV